MLHGAQEARADRDRTEQFASNLQALNSQFTRSVLPLLRANAALLHTPSQHAPVSPTWRHPALTPQLIPSTRALPCSWVNTQKASNPQKFWVEGVRDYVRHASKLLDEFGDLLTADGVATLKAAAAGAYVPFGCLQSLA